MTYRVRQDGGSWIWEMVFDNGRVVARSTKTFGTEALAYRSVRRVIEFQGGYYVIDRPSSTSVAFGWGRDA